MVPSSVPRATPARRPLLTEVNVNAGHYYATVRASLGVCSSTASVFTQQNIHRPKENGPCEEHVFCSLAAPGHSSSHASPSVILVGLVKIPAGFSSKCVFVIHIYIYS